METAILVNVISIHALVILLLVLVVRARKQPALLNRAESSNMMPIRHQKIAGPTTAKITREIGYWRPKDDSNAEPFLAAWYEKDTTLDGILGDSELDTPIPADTYVDLTGRRIAGEKFRSFYEPAEEVMVVNKVKTKTRNSDLVTGKADSPKLSPEEEQSLADEYELTDRGLPRKPK